MALLLSADRDTHEIRVVYAATLLLGIAYGVSISLTALHLDARHFTKASIGSLAAVFALGIVLFSVPIGRLIERFSAKRTLLGALVGYACAVAAFPWLTTWTGVAVARFFDGAFSVGIWVSCETILLARAAHANESRDLVIGGAHTRASPQRAKRREQLRRLAEGEQ